MINRGRPQAEMSAMAAKGLARIAELYGDCSQARFKIDPNEERCKRGVCPMLRKDGEPATLADSEQYKGRQWHILKDGAAWTCQHRPHEHDMAAWTADVCLSTWHRDCPYKPEPERPTRLRWVETASAGYKSRRDAA